jgi:hypothetical protein
MAEEEKEAQNGLIIGQTNKDNISFENFHIGKFIKSILQSDGRSISWFAFQMNCDRSNMYKVLAKPHHSSEFLIRASRVLGYDLFAAISEWLKREALLGENREFL